MTAVRRLAIAVVLAAGLAVVVLGTIGWPASAYRDGDFTQFWVQPHALLDGADPYDSSWWTAAHAGIGQRPENAQAVYPPHDAVAFLPFALLPLPYAAAAWIVTQLAVVCVAVALLASCALPRSGRGLFIAVALAFQPLWLLAVGANVTGFLFAALVGAFVAVTERRLFVAGALLGLLVLKPHPFVFLAFALLVSATWPERRRLAQGALCTAGPLVLATVTLRPGWYAEWFNSAIALAGSPRSNATVWTLDRLAGLPSWSGPLVAALAIGAFATWSARVRPPLAPTFVAAIPVSVAVAPYGWSYDQLQLLVPIAVALAATGGLARRALIALAAAILPWALYGLAFRRGGEELSVVTPLLVFAVLLTAPVTLGAERQAP